MVTFLVKSLTRDLVKYTQALNSWSWNVDFDMGCEITDSVKVNYLLIVPYLKSLIHLASHYFLMTACTGEKETQQPIVNVKNIQTLDREDCATWFAFGILSIQCGANQLNVWVNHLGPMRMLKVRTQCNSKTFSQELDNFSRNIIFNLLFGNLGSKLYQDSKSCMTLEFVPMWFMHQWSRLLIWQTSMYKCHVCRESLIRLTNLLRTDLELSEI